MNLHRHDKLDRHLRTLEKAFEPIQIGVTITDTESRIIDVTRPTRACRQHPDRGLLRPSQVIYMLKA